MTDGRENSLLGRMCFSISLTARYAHYYVDIQCCDWVLIVSRAGGSNLTVVRPFPKKGGPGVLSRKVLEKCCLLVHFGTI